MKITMEDLLHGKTFRTVIDEQIIFSQLNQRTSAVWSLLLAQIEEKQYAAALEG